MKYTIHGFSQQEAIKFQKTIEENGKRKEIRIDCTDLLILRWFVDFYPSMMKAEMDGTQYAWVQYKKILQDLPLIDMKKRALFDRLKKLCDFKILKHKVIKGNGSFSYYGFGEMYDVLIGTVCSQLHTGVQSTAEGVCSQLPTGMQSTAEQIDSSIKDSSIKDNKSIKNKKKKERKKTSYEEILSLVADDRLRELYLEYIKMRTLMKAPMTDRALTMLINRVNDLEPDSIERQKQMLETAIMNNWKSVYPLKDREQPKGKDDGKWCFTPGEDSLDDVF